MADASGSVHLFWFGWFSDQTEGSTYIFYSVCDTDNCTEPVDILVGPNGADAIYPEATVDSSGTLQLTFLSSGRLYHTSALHDAADNPQAWTTPQEIGRGSGSITSPTGIAIDSNGGMHAVFADPYSVYHVASHDGGNTWGTPNVIFTAPTGLFTHFARLAIGPRDELHVVWSMVPDNPTGFPVQGVFYAFSDDGGEGWSPAQELAGADYGEPTIITDSMGGVHVAHNARVGVGGKYYTTSNDGGITWTTSLDLGVKHEGTGLNGHPNLAVDSNDDLHFIGGGDAFWLVSQKDRVWRSPDNLTAAFSALNALQLGYTERPDLAVSGGNQLHLAFYDVVVEGEMGRIWHTWKAIDAPATPLRPYADPVLEPTATPSLSTLSPTPTVESAELAVPLPDLKPSSVDTVSGVRPLVAGGGASLLLVLAVVVLSFRRRRR